MKNSFLEVNKHSSIKQKQNKKELNSNIKYNIFKNNTKKEEKAIKQEKNALPKSTAKSSLKKNKEVPKKQMKQFLTNNNIENKNKNTQNNRNILKKNIENNNINNKSKKSNIKNYSKNKSTINLNQNNIPKSPSLTHNKNANFQNNYCSKNHFIGSNNSPKISEIIKNGKRNKNVNKKNNNNVLKTNLGLLITNNHNCEGDSMFNDNESYFENNNLFQLNKGKRHNNKSDSIVKEYVTENYLTKVDNRKNENSSLLNSIININKYLTNDINSKSTNRINKDRNNKIKYKKTYENQLDKMQISKNIVNDKNITNESKSDFFQNNQKKEKIKNKKNEVLINKNINNEYYCSYRTLNNTNKIIKKNSFNLDDCINKNNIFVDYILGYNTPRVTINNDFFKDFKCSPKNFNINKTLVNTDSDFKSYSKKRIKVKLHQNNNSDQMSIIKAINNIKLDLNEDSTKSNSSKNNNVSTEKINLMKINEFQSVTEFDLTNKKNEKIKKNCNNIFDEEYYQKDIQINEYNLKENLKLEFSGNNNTRNKKRKNNNSCISCIYSPINIHNKYNTLSFQCGNNYNFTQCKNIQKNENYLKTLEEEEENIGKIQEIKIKLNNNNKTRNKPRANIYYHSPSYRLSEESKYIEENNRLNIISSFENIKGKVNKVYTKQIFSNYNMNSKSKEKSRINRDKINTEKINKFSNLKEDYVNKKCIYSNPKNININNNIFQQNNFYTTNNYFNSNSKRIDSNENKNCSPKIYVKPSKHRNNPTNIYLNSSPKNQNYSPNILEDEAIKFKAKNTYNKCRTKAFIKKSSNINKNINISHGIKSKVVNNSLICKKYYDYFLNIKQLYKPLCYISKEIVKAKKHISKNEKNLITELIHSIFQKPKSFICFITKINISQFKSDSSLINPLDDKKQNIIKANILDFSVEQNKLKSNDTNNNRIIRYISNEKNYQESFGEINLSFSTEEINSFRQKESTIEGFFNELNINTDLINNESEAKITFCPILKNNNINFNNNYETTTTGRMIHNSPNYTETERTERNERTSYKRDETIREDKEDINLKVDLTFKLNEVKENDNIMINTEKMFLNNNTDKVINFSENNFEMKKNDIKIKFNTDKMNKEYINYKSKNKKSNKNLELSDIHFKKFNKINSEKNDNKSDFIYLLNIITIHNINSVNNQILKIIKLENNSINTFDVILRNKFNNEKKYSILYSLLCKKLLNELNEREIKNDTSLNILNISKEYDDIIHLNTYQQYIFNLYENILFNKMNNIKSYDFNYLNHFDILNKRLLNIIQHDLSNNNNIIDILFFDKYKTFKLSEIIQHYIEVCIDNIYPNKLLSSNCNNFIYKMISQYSKNITIKTELNELDEIFMNIDNILIDNKNMFDILGYLLYCLIIFDIYPYDNFNYFLNSDEFTIINFAKILKYTFSLCFQNNNKFPLEFRETKLYKINSQIFEKYSF